MPDILKSKDIKIDESKKTVLIGGKSLDRCIASNEDFSQEYSEGD